MKKFYVAALTGRSGSGKSVASQYLSQKGVSVIDGDVVAREVVAVGEPCLDELVRAFSRDILNPDGTLNRRYLGDLCFADPKKKKKLDAITHPYIIDRSQEYFDEQKRLGAHYCVVEAGALIESGLYAWCDKTIMVTADEDKEIERICKRDSLTEEQAKRRLQAQMHPDEIQDLCDVILTNNGTLAEFYAKLDELHRQMDAWFAN